MTDKNTIKKLRLAITACVIVTAMTATIGQSFVEAKDVCQSEITSTATARSKNAALTTAIEKWQADVKQAHNQTLAHWKNAKSKNKHCTAVAGKWPNQTFTCVVTASPCP